jgi:hypothetical protein
MTVRRLRIITRRITDLLACELADRRCRWSIEAEKSQVAVVMARTTVIGCS